MKTFRANGISPKCSTPTRKSDGRRVPLLFFAIAAILLSTEELKVTTAELERNGETIVVELERTGTESCCLELDEFPGAELGLSTYCACRGAGSEADWVRLEETILDAISAEYMLKELNTLEKLVMILRPCSR